MVSSQGPYKIQLCCEGGFLSVTELVGGWGSMARINQLSPVQLAARNMVFNEESQEDVWENGSVMDVSGRSRRVPPLWTSFSHAQGGLTFKGVMNGEERSYGWVRPTSRHLSREFERRYGVRNARSFVSKYSCRARFERCSCHITAFPGFHLLHISTNIENRRL
ncbi:unnamed protein product [Brugia pahangi]|uniref:SH2 domain-containing protein n=1 Tax=Brugia pahangi TaxID=6280 RepID=A0A0N4T5E4_BRUPA|nr:unnamed protein product [Brugia pahangi]